MNGIRVGRWSVNASGTHEFTYDEGWLTAPNARPISLSLPLAPPDFTYSGKTVASFFDNLLPDSAEIRQRIRARYGTLSTAPFDLLTEIGRDCVGALQLLPENEQPLWIASIAAADLDDNELETILTEVTSPGLGTRKNADAFRISIAGAQEKTALLFHDGKWKLPRGSTPTTHILKLPLGRVGGLGVDLSLSVENRMALRTDPAEAWRRDSRVRDRPLRKGHGSCRGTFRPKAIPGRFPDHADTPGGSLPGHRNLPNG